MGGHKGIGRDLLGNSTTADTNSLLYGGTAAGQNAVLQPTLANNIANPTGYTPTQVAAQTTAAEQTAGGTNAGATGGALLRAARTRNAGAAQPAASEAGRNASQQLSQINAGIQSKNADLAQRNKQQAISTEAGLYGTNVGASNRFLDTSNTALKNAGDLSNFWQQLLLEGVKSAGDVGAGYAANS